MSSASPEGYLNFPTVSGRIQAGTGTMIPGICIRPLLLLGNAREEGQICNELHYEFNLVLFYLFRSPSTPSVLTDEQLGKNKSF